MAAKDKIRIVNPKHEPLTVEKLRELSGLDLSDEQAEEVVWSIRQFVRVLYKYKVAIQQEKSAKTENEPDV